MGIGTGDNNTIRIIAQSPTAGRAATASRAYAGGGLMWHTQGSGKVLYSDLKSFF